LASIVSVNASARKGRIKRPVQEGRLVVDVGLAGDAHALGGHRQLSLLASESIEKMSAQCKEPFAPGMFAENITTEGVELYTLPVGTRLRLGECLVEITQIGKECHSHCEIFQRLGSCIMPVEGVFARVLAGGAVRAGDGVELEAREN